MPAVGGLLSVGGLWEVTGAAHGGGAQPSCPADEAIASCHHCRRTFTLLTSSSPASSRDGRSPMPDFHRRPDPRKL